MMRGSGPADCVIVGGGAAGFFAAIACAENSPGARVVLLEKAKNPLAKVKISGGGRCNVTHACFDPRELVAHFPRGGRELLGPFHTWQPSDTVEWFESHGVSLKTEADGRMFPVSDSSQSIVDCLARAARQAGVTVRTGVGLLRAEPQGETFLLTLSGNERLDCSRLLIACGGLKSVRMREVVESFGHTIEPLAPSLFTFHVRDQRIEKLAGLSVGRVMASIPEAGLEQSGPLLVTHWGLSGPAILKLSAWGARWIQDSAYKFICRIDWSGGLGLEALGERLRSMRRKQGRKHVAKSPMFDLPRRLWERLVAAADVGEDIPWSRLNAGQLKALAGQLTACDLEVEGKSMNKEEFVTCGGVCLKEVNFKTMESRLIPRLYFAGEVLDIDAVTGGFNFQAAWTTGLLAGRAMSGVRH